MHYVYIIELENGDYYVGKSSNLKERIKAHVLGRCTSTKLSRTIKLKWYCAFDNRNSATQFEKYLKSSSGYAFRNKHLIGDS